MTDEELHQHHVLWAMRIASDLSVPKETALKILELAREAIIWADDQPEHREFRSEAA